MLGIPSPRLHTPSPREMLASRPIDLASYCPALLVAPQRLFAILLARKLETAGEKMHPNQLTFETNATHLSGRRPRLCRTPLSSAK